MTASRHFVVDRLHGTTAVLVAEDQEPISIAVTRLPSGIREGTVLRVRVDGDGAVAWESAEFDEMERRRLEREARDRLDRLRQRDPGGDIST